MLISDMLITNLLIVRIGPCAKVVPNIPFSLYSTITEKHFHVNIQGGTELLGRLSCAIISYVIYTAGTHQEPINGYSVLRHGGHLKLSLAVKYVLISKTTILHRMSGIKIHTHIQHTLGDFLQYNRMMKSHFHLDCIYHSAKYYLRKYLL